MKIFYDKQQTDFLLIIFEQLTMRPNCQEWTLLREKVHGGGAKSGKIISEVY